MFWRWFPLLQLVRPPFSKPGLQCTNQEEMTRCLRKECYCRRATMVNKYIFQEFIVSLLENCLCQLRLNLSLSFRLLFFVSQIDIDCSIMAAVGKVYLISTLTRVLLFPPSSFSSTDV